MNDLERAAERFKDWEDVRADREVKRAAKEVHTQPLMERLRADQFQLLWKAIARVGGKYQPGAYTGDGKMDRMYTEMANEAAQVMLKVMKSPQLRMRGKRKVK